MNWFNMLGSDVSSTSTTPEAHSQDAQWISLSDLMTGLMMVFMLVAVAFMVQMEQINKQAQTEIVAYDALKAKIYQDLYAEFKDDLKGWNAELTKDLVFSLKDSEVLFAVGDDQIKPRFQQILLEFFPRYIAILSQNKANISEIRIEGHTSSLWYGVSPEEAYFNNMALSQARTRSTLRYVLELVNSEDKVVQTWLKQTMTANGLSSARPVLNSDGSENMAASQRVEFKVVTDAESHLLNIKRSLGHEAP